MALTTPYVLPLLAQCWQYLQIPCVSVGPADNGNNRFKRLILFSAFQVPRDRFPKQQIPLNLAWQLLSTGLHGDGHPHGIASASSTSCQRRLSERQNPADLADVASNGPSRKSPGEIVVNHITGIFSQKPSKWSQICMPASNFSNPGCCLGLSQSQREPSPKV
jgi:hypothetical protein